MSKEPFQAEEFKPIPVRRGSGFVAELLFNARLAVDLQLLTCVRFLKPHLATMHGRVLDVGCGEMPFRYMLPRDASYTGIDTPAADAFGMAHNPDIVTFDGKTIPFPDNSFDLVLCTEVLEHTEDPIGLLQEMRRVLRPGGFLVATVPFSARVHHAPHDFHRFTRYRLGSMLGGFKEISIEERGDDLAVIANKLIVICARLSKNLISWRIVPFVLAAIPGVPAIVLAHLSLVFDWGSKADPLGYGVIAQKE